MCLNFQCSIFNVQWKIRTFAPAFKKSKHWRDGRVVDYSSLENYRTERYRGSYKITPKFTPKNGEFGFYFAPNFGSTFNRRYVKSVKALMCTDFQLVTSVYRVFEAYSTPSSHSNTLL